MSEHVTDDEWPSRVIQDYGTSNLLYISYIPLISNLGDEELERIKADVETGFAFEIEKAESQIHDRLRKKKLPADSAVASRVERTIYRAKSIDLMREHALTQ